MQHNATQELLRCQGSPLGHWTVMNSEVMGLRWGWVVPQHTSSHHPQKPAFEVVSICILKDAAISVVKMICVLSCFVMFCPEISDLPADALSVGNDPEAQAWGPVFISARNLKLRKTKPRRHHSECRKISPILSSNIENGTHVKTSFILAKDLQRNAISTTFFDFRLAPVRWNAIGHEVVRMPPPHLHRYCLSLAWRFRRKTQNRQRILSNFANRLLISFHFAPFCFCPHTSCRSKLLSRNRNFAS